MEKTRILIVEDEILVARDIQAALKNLGYEVVGTASTGEKAIEKIQETSPDLVIVDIALKGTMDGIDLAERIRRNFKKPFIYLTALSDENTVQRAKITEPFGYIYKPFEQKELHTTVDMALYKYKMELKIRESEEKLRNLFMNAVEGIFQTTPDGRFLTANPSMARMLGFESPEELIASRTDIERQGYVLPKRRAEFKQLLERQGEVFNFEYQTYRQDRSIIWLSENVRAVKDAEGKILYYEGTAQDITESKRNLEIIRIQRDLALAISTAANLEEGLRQCLETAIRVSEMDCGGIYLVNESSGALDLVTHQGLSPEFITNVSHYEANSPNTHLVMSGKPIYTEHLHLGVPLEEKERQEGLRAIAVLPVRHDDRVIGCLNISSHSKPEVPFFVRNVLETIAAQIGNSIAHLQAEEALQRSEERYKELWENAPVAYHMLDKKGIIIKVNQKEAKMLGYKPDEMKGKSIFSFILPEQRNEAQKRFQQKVQGLFIPRAEDRIYVRKDGSQVYVVVDDVLEQDSEGKIIGVRTTMTDITELKRAEESLRESEERFRRLSESSIEGIIFHDKGKIIDANQAFAAMFGYSLSGVIGKNALDFATPELRNKALQHIRTRSEEPYDGLAIRKDGSIFPVEVLGRNAPYKGRTIRLTAVHDITERKRAEEALRKSEASYRELADSITDVFFAMDKNLKYTYWNKASEELTGISAKDAMGKSLHKIFVDTPERKKAEKAYRNVLRTQQPQSFVNEFHLGGKEYFFEISAYPTKDGLSVFVKDITEQKNTEDALAKYAVELQQLSSQLISAQEAERKRISQELHDELGQALTMVRINLSSIKKSLSPAQWIKIKDKIEEADAQTEKLLEQIHELTLDLRPHMLDDLGFLPTLRWYTERFSKRLNIKIQITQKNWKDSLDSEVATAIFRIIQETLTNVVRHAQAQMIHISLTQKKNLIEAVIEDDGRGFDQSEIESRPPQERGIGLFGIKERAAFLNGKCTITSRPGQGTRVHIAIPWRKANGKN